MRPLSVAECWSEFEICNIAVSNKLIDISPVIQFEWPNLWKTGVCWKQPGIWFVGFSNYFVGHRPILAGVGELLLDAIHKKYNLHPVSARIARKVVFPQLIVGVCLALVICGYSLG